MVGVLTSQGCGLGFDNTCGLSSLMVLVLVLVLVLAPNGLSLGSNIQNSNSTGGQEEPPHGLFTVK